MINVTQKVDFSLYIETYFMPNHLQEILSGNTVIKIKLKK